MNTITTQCVRTLHAEITVHELMDSERDFRACVVTQWDRSLGVRGSGEVRAHTFYGESYHDIKAPNRAALELAHTWELEVRQREEG